VRVNAIAPGPTETEGIARLPIPKEMFETMKQQILKQVPLGRMATSSEVARWIVTLSDPNVTWLTGQVLGIDGGLSVS
jgi:NAD(P)-dependent dehydrogenase (short-subunit alcohol dehydrogenase family)